MGLIHLLATAEPSLEPGLGGSDREVENPVPADDVGAHRPTVATAAVHRDRGIETQGLSQWKCLDSSQSVRRYEHARPGEIVHMDIKKLGRFHRVGHRVTSNRAQDSRGVGWE